MNTDEGRIAFTQVCILAVILFVGLQASKLIAPWRDYLRLKETMQEAINQAPVLTEAEVIQTVMAHARDLHVPLAPQDIHVIRTSEGGMRMYAEYDMTMTFPLGFARMLSFRPEVFRRGPAATRGNMAR